MQIINCLVEFIEILSHNKNQGESTKRDGIAKSEICLK